MNFIWGVKTEAMFDVWSLEHLLVGMSLASGVWLITDARWKKILDEVESLNPLIRFKDNYDLICVLLLAFMWESLEHYLEQGLLGDRVEYWFQGTEFWANRLITDPLMVVAGYFIAKNYRYLAVPGRVLSLLWLLVHIFLFPHSMYLHEIF